VFIDKSTRRDRLGARTTVQLRGVVVVVFVSTWKANCVTTRADFREPAVFFSDLYCGQPAVYKAVFVVCEL